MEQSQTLGQRLARYVRNVLALAVLAIAGLLIANKVTTSSVNPFHINSAHADIISAAPGFLALTVPLGGGNFYLVDSNNEVICVYQLDGEKIRLTSARYFGRDSDIVDSSLPIWAGNKVIKIEGGNGVTSAEAAFYAEGLKAELEKLKNKKR